jgi:competence protein ComEC
VDWDHTSLLTRVLDKYEVDLAFYPDRKDALTSATWKTIHAKIEDEVRIPIPAGTDGSYLGKRFLIGDASFRILTGYNVPPSAYGIAATESKKSEYNNAASIVARLAYWGRSVLFMGDSYGGPDGDATDEPKWGEGDILAKQPDYLVRSDVIVAGHHGANNASFIDFIDKVRPTFVVFASGQGHDHPRKATADRFFQTRASDDKKVSAANVFRTDRDDPREDPAKEWQGGHGPTNGSDRFDDEIVIEMVRGEAVKVKYAKATS